MYYSETIWNLFYVEGMTAKEIAARIDVPIINEQFCAQVIANNRWLRRPPIMRYRKWERPEWHKKLRSEITYRQQQGLHRRPKNYIKNPKKKKALW